MAAAMEIVCVLSGFLNLESVFRELKDHKVDARAVKMFSMDNWRWENQKEVQSFSEADSLLRDQKIIVVNTGLRPFRESGIYIEKVRDRYIYEFWIDTEGFPELDSDVITIKNRGFLRKLEKIILHFTERHFAIADLICVGCEMTFEYDEDIADTIRKTDSPLMWFVPGSPGRELTIKGYGKKAVSGVEVFVKNKK